MSQAIIALSLLVASTALVSCGGSSGGAGSGAEDAITADGPDSPDCPVRNHLAVDPNGADGAG